MRQGGGSPEILIDGLAFEVQKVGGISQIFRASLPRLCDHGARIALFTSGRLQQALPSHDRLEHIRLADYGRLTRPEGRAIPVAGPFRRALFGSALRDHPHWIWQSTYFTLPPHRWRGPNVALIPDLIYELFPALLNSTGDRLFRKQRHRYISAADVIVCISEATKTDLMANFDLGSVPVHVVHLAAGDAYRAPSGRQQVKSERAFFLYVGGRDSYKNFRIVIDAWTLPSLRSEAQLVVAGPPFSDQEKRLIRDRGLVDGVTHVGRPTDTQLSVLYAKASGLIYPSLYEGFGIPLVEAMSCGCPIIASDIPSSHEVAQGCATYFDPSSASALVTAVEKVLSTTSTNMVRCGFERARDFSWQRTAASLYDIYAAL